MKSAVITSGEHWLTIDGINYLRGTIETIERLKYNDGREALKISGSSVNADVILVDGTTIDGVEVNSQDELVDFIKEHSFLIKGGASGEGLDRATIQQIQDGTNNDNYVTPYLVHAFVEWFSSQLLLIDEEYTDMPTSAQVNEKYPNARVRTLLYLPNSGSGMKYTKLNETQWESQPYTIA